MNRLTTRHAVKKTQLHYPCRVCSRECSYEESIQCDGCQCWLHQHCIRMMLTRYVEYRQKPSLQFFCLQCACDSDGHYNFSVSLEHIACLAPDVSRMRDQAETENRLLALYGITLPQLSAPYARDVVVDRPSVSLLQRHSQWLLKQYVAAAVGADGNCLFRAVVSTVRTRRSVQLPATPDNDRSPATARLVWLHKCGVLRTIHSWRQVDAVYVW